MGDPYAPVVHVPTYTPEADTELARLLRRLRALGATPDELAQVQAHWDDLDEDFTAEDRTRFVNAPASVMLEAIAAVRREHAAHTMTADEQAHASTVWAEATAQLEGNVAKVLAWVDAAADSTDWELRARAVVEQETSGRRRSTLLGPLRERLGLT